jgi:deoxyribodipyrimidine photolyase
MHAHTLQHVVYCNTQNEQLLWREFFYLCAHTVPNFGQMEGNALCKQIPWDNNPELLAGLHYHYIHTYI